VVVPSGDVGALIEAVETANSNGGGTILIESGVYDIGQPLPDIVSPIRFVGADRDLTQLLETTFQVQGSDGGSGKLSVETLSVENTGCRSIARIGGEAIFIDVKLRQNLTQDDYDEKCDNEDNAPGISDFSDTDISIQKSIIEASIDVPVIQLMQDNSVATTITDSIISGINAENSSAGFRILRSNIGGVGIGYGTSADIRDSTIQSLGGGNSPISRLTNTTVLGDISVGRSGAVEGINVTVGGRAFRNEPSHGGDCLLRNSLVNEVGEGENACVLDNSLDGKFSDLLVGELSDNGEPGGLHYPLLAGSPAIDAGIDGLCTEADQLGQARVDGNGDGLVTCDIGAVEFVSSGSKVISMDYAPNDPQNRTGVNSTGNVGVYIFGESAFSVRDIAIDSLRLGLGQASAIEGASKVLDGNGDSYSDLLVRFRVPELQINCAQESIELLGAASNGGRFSGTDVIRPQACKSGIMDFKPNDPNNRVDPNSDALVGVYIFSTQKGQGEAANIDAAAIVIDSVRMGPALADTGGLPHRVADFDGDGDEDLLVRFRGSELGLNCGDTEIVLGGRTVDGRGFGATDWVDVVACR